MEEEVQGNVLLDEPRVLDLDGTTRPPSTNGDLVDSEITEERSIGLEIRQSSRPSFKFLPISPETFQRYSRNRIIEKCPTEFIVPPLSRSFLIDPPSQWCGYRHPEGGRYFVYKNKRIFTDCYLFDDAVLVQITSAVDQLLAKPECQFLSRTDTAEIDIVLDLMREDPENDECGYYFVDHSERVIFWLDVFNMSTLPIWNLVPGIKSPSHVKLGLEVEYWSHCGLFPASMTLSSTLVHELRDIIIFGVGDSMTSTTTTVSYPLEHLLRMLSLTKEMLDELPGGSTSASRKSMNHGSIVILARFMKEFSCERFYHFHGEKSARLNNEDSVYGDIPSRSYLIRLISPILFNAPLHYLRAFEVVNTDQLINYSSWHKLITALRSEWYDLVLYGTLILNTNVGFLSIPASGNSTAGQIASYVSICLGLGSIILGIMFLRKYRLESPEVPDVTPAGIFFQNHGGSIYGLEVLSIVHSLPYALMIWGMINFILALLLTVFQTNSIEMRGVILATVLTVTFAICGFVSTEKQWNQQLKRLWMKPKIISTMWNYNPQKRSSPGAV
ncbi:hypothetical protein C8F04DRAFT_1127919 [Mycena alexandri]|uniref:Uncharacterized protein n=1 Tax=Mycena alexandri TaxID=1745969 RepID=A0AAD6SDM0_9AGAR|nr:hypothetical protein C8F04DRAFT_1127919 [Mycena alexandri]